MDETTRRRFLQISGLTGVTTGAGCLRLATDQSESGSETRTSSINSDTGDGGPSTAQNSEAEETSTEQNSDDELPSIGTLYEAQWQKEEVLEHLSSSNGYVYGFDYEITKIDQSSGDVIWENEPSRIEYNHINDLIAMDEYVFVFGGGVPNEDISTHLYSLNTQNGTERWFFEGEFAEWQGGNQLAASNGYVAFVESSPDSGYIIRAFRWDSADPIWKKEYAEDGIYANSIYIRDDKLFTLGGSARVLDIDSGELLQKNENVASHGVVTETSVYTGGVELRKLSRPELEVEWTFKPTSRLTASPQVAAGEDPSIIVPNAYGLECVGSKNGEIQWKYRTASEILDTRGGVEIVSGLVWACGNAGFLYVVDLETGEALFDKQQKNDPAMPSDLEADESTLYLSFASDMNTMFPSGTSKLSVTDPNSG